MLAFITLIENKGIHQAFTYTSKHSSVARCGGSSWHWQYQLRSTEREVGGEPALVNLPLSQVALHGVPQTQVTESSTNWEATGVKLRLQAFTQSQNAVRARVHVDSLHTKQTKPNIFLCRSSLTTTAVLRAIWMNLSSMFNETIQPTGGGCFSEGNCSWSVSEGTNIKECTTAGLWWTHSAI